MAPSGTSVCSPSFEWYLKLTVILIFINFQMSGVFWNPKIIFDVFILRHEVKLAAFFTFYTVISLLSKYDHRWYFEKHFSRTLLKAVEAFVNNSPNVVIETYLFPAIGFHEAKDVGKVYKSILKLLPSPSVIYFLELLFSKL